MQLTQFRAPLLAALSFGTLLGPLLGQDKATAAGNVDMTGLPAFLLPVPAGTVDVGLDWQQLFEAACQVANPSAPKEAVKRAAEKLFTSLKLEVRTLGRKRTEVPAFLLAKAPVKNSEYEPYVRASAGKVRMPLQWWMVGRKDDFEKRREEIDKQFPKQKRAFLLYWDANYKELPYALKDDKGEPIDDLPVTMISWRDANDFAGSLGMRLPTEAELTRASRGDSDNIWPSDKPDGGAKFSNALLETLRIAEGKDMTLKPVGGGMAGPYGHTDLHGHIWQFVANLGFAPINGNELYATQWKEIGKDAKSVKQLAELKEPEWRADKVIAKGGAYNASQAPTMLLIDARRPCQVDDTLEMLGFRLAKSMKPGYDMIFSRLQGTYNRNWFGEEQDPDLGAQFGAERYDLGDNGFPTAYHGVSFAPINFLSKEKSTELNKLVEKSPLSPML
ncbi:MAG: formylglycine-generating enzyme family protein, partial [Gemmatimonas sp.]